MLFRSRRPDSRASARGNAARRRATAWRRAGTTRPTGGTSAGVSRTCPTMARRHKGAHDGRAPDPGKIQTREGPATVGPVLTRSCCSASFSVLPSVRSPPDPVLGAVGAGATLSAGRHTHRRDRGLVHTPDFTPSGLLCGVTDTDIGDATSTRRTGLLGRACRLHRQLLSTRGNGGCSVAARFCPVSASTRPV